MIRQQSLTRSIGSQTEDGTRGGPVVATMDRTRQELEDKITSLQDEIKIKEAERKYYQDDHDKVCESWNTTKEELRMKEAELKMKDKMLEEAKLDHLTEVKLKELLEREVQRKEQERQCYQAERDKVCESWITTKEELRMKEAELRMKDKMLEETKLAHSTEVKMKEHLQREIEKKEEDRRYYQTERDKFYGYWKTAQEQLKIKEAELQMKDKMLEQKKLEHSTELELKGCLQHEIDKKEDRQYYQTEHDKFYEHWKTMQEQLKAKEAQLQMKDKMLEETKVEHLIEVKDDNKELQRRERILQIKFDALSRKNEFLKGVHSYYHGEVTIQKDAKSVNRFGVNHIESERDAFHSNFKSLSQPAENRMMTKATPAEQKGQTIQENLGMKPALRLPPLPRRLSASCQPLELNEELAGMSGETGQLEITARQSGPPTELSH